MIKKVFLLTFSFLIHFALVAQEEVAANNYLQWGKIQVPIGELVNGSNGQIELKLSEVIDSADEPMVLKKNGEDAKLTSFFFIISKMKNTAPPEFVRIENYDKKDAKNIHGKFLISAHLKEGELIYLRNLKGKDSEEYSLSIKILYEKSPHKLGFEIPDIPKGEVFNFQIMDFGKEKIQVKIDTTDIANERIFNTYKDLRKYEIVHIPNFKTTRRYITKEDKIEFKNEIQSNWIEDGFLKNIDIEMLPEFSNYDGTTIELKWGEMASSTRLQSTSQIQEDIVVESSTGDLFTFKAYDRYDLEDALESRFMLSQGYQTFQVVRFKLVILTNDKNPISYILEDIKNLKLREELLKIHTQTTLLFTDILIKNNEGDLLYFPPSFLFGIQ